MKKRTPIAAAALVGSTAAMMMLGRHWQLRWGATGEEIDARLPGDDLIPDPDLVATRAITILTSAERVWPWLAQLGQGRGGFYSYDALENLVGCDIHSADEIVPEWQDIRVDDEVRLAPRMGLTVAAVEPNRALVLRAGARTGEMPVPYDFTWAFVLREQPDATTRLVVRERYDYARRWASLVVEPVEAIDFMMTRRMLRGIRDRAELAVTTAAKRQSAVTRQSAATR